MSAWNEHAARQILAQLQGDDHDLVHQTESADALEGALAEIRRLREELTKWNTAALRLHLADARRAGARAMQERCAVAAENFQDPCDGALMAETIRVINPEDV